MNIDKEVAVTGLFSRLRAWFARQPINSDLAAALRPSIPQSVGPLPAPQDDRADQLPTLAEMDELLAYLPRLYPAGIAIQTCTVRENSPWPDYVPVVKDFYRLVDKECWCDVDYVNHHAHAVIKDDAFIAQATMADLQAMLTFCIRGERFCDGHQGAMIEHGHVLDLLNRLAVLRQARS